MLLLLNLQVTIDKGSLNLECGKAMAQSMLEETLPNIVVIPDPFTTCEKCYASVAKKDLEGHLEKECPKNFVVCSYCHESYLCCNGHNCIIVHYCYICYKPIDKCTCEGAVVTGDDRSGSGRGRNGGTVIVIHGGGGPAGNGGSNEDRNSEDTGQFSNESGKTVSVSDLKFKNGVKLLYYITLPDKLHPQTRKMECVLRAYAFMAEMKGYDYDRVFEALDRIAKKGKRNLNIEGIGLSELSTFFREYCQIGAGYNDPAKIAGYIDRGIPVAAVTCTTPYHMVTIIGYDHDYYYTAAGDGSGNVTIYSKDQLSCFDYFYLYNTTNIPFQ